MIEITPRLDKSADSPLYFQVYNYIKSEIQKGHIHPGTKLPSIRNLSAHLRVSRNTIENAYQQLIAEGYIESRPRSGLYVVDIDNELLLRDDKVSFSMYSHSYESKKNLYGINNTNFKNLL